MMISDSNRLDWLIQNRSVVATGGERSLDKFYFIIYRNGETGGAFASARAAIDEEIKATNASEKVID